jgi:formate/nitrite transporter FocA (FNT family)
MRGPVLPAKLARMTDTKAPLRPHAPDQEVNSAFQRTVDEGRTRLGRTWPGLLSTGFVGGVDIGIGVLALLVVRERTGSALLGALAFGIGFIALTLGRSELFTENFLVPVAAVVARDGRPSALLRLWGATLVANLAACWLMAAIIVGALPAVRPVAVELAQHAVELPAGEAFLLAVLGGIVITLMTWMERSSGSDFGRLFAAMAVAFLLAAVPLNHVIVSAVEFFAALVAGAPFGYARWAGAAALAALGNAVGGLAFVTVLRLVQVGRDELARHRSDVPSGA